MGMLYFKAVFAFSCLLLTGDLWGLHFDFWCFLGCCYGVCSVVSCLFF